MVQSQAVSDTVSNSAATFGTPAPAWTVGLTVAVLAALVILGGIRSIGRFTGTFVPAMIVACMAGATVILTLNWRQIFEAVTLVFQGAFSGTAAAGGFPGRRGGGPDPGAGAPDPGLHDPDLHRHPGGLHLPRLAIISTGAWREGLDGAGLTQVAFRTGLPGQWSGLIVAVSLSLFAFSAMLGWA